MAANDAEENTHWIEVWALNDPDHYDNVVKKGHEGPDSLREYITSALVNAPAESAAWYTGKEMTTSDYDKVDWAEVANTLTAR